MLLALNAFKVDSTPTPSTARTPIGLLLALTRRGAEVAPPATARTPIGLLLALTRPAVPGIPPIEPPIEPPTASGVGGVSRGRMIRKFRKRKEEDEEEPIPVIGSTPVAEAPPGPSLPPQPGLMAHMPPLQPAKIPKRADPDEEEDEIALLLELIS